MLFKHRPSRGSVSNELDLSLSPSRGSKAITNVNDLCLSLGEEPEAESGGAQGELSFSFHFFSLGCALI